MGRTKISSSLCTQSSQQFESLLWLQIQLLQLIITTFGGTLFHWSTTNTIAATDAGSKRCSMEVQLLLLILHTVYNCYQCWRQTVFHRSINTTDTKNTTVTDNGRHPAYAGPENLLFTVVAITLLILKFRSTVKKNNSTVTKSWNEKNRTNWCFCWEITLLVARIWSLAFLPYGPLLFISSLMFMGHMLTQTGP